MLALRLILSRVSARFSKAALASMHAPDAIVVLLLSGDAARAPADAARASAELVTLVASTLPSMEYCLE